MNFCAQTIIQIIQSYSIPVTNEKEMQAILGECFDAEGIAFEREVSVGHGDIIDFLFSGGIGLEVKIKGQQMAIYRQLRRYAQSPDVKELILYSGRAMGLPSDIEGKPCHLVSIGRGHL